VYYFYVVFLILWIHTTTLSAQGSNYSNLRVISLDLPSKDTTFQLDSLSIIPSSFQVFESENLVSQDSYYVDFASAFVTFKSSVNKKIWIKYRVYPYLFSKWTDKNPILFKANESLGVSLANQSENKTVYTLQKKNATLLQMDGIEYNGSFFRGVTVGNNQDLALHSGFNMSLNGKLPNGIEVVASITDANIPIQPEGNSASIQEFDRIFIHLKKDQHRLTLGDFDIKEINPSYFLKFDRKLQGIQAKTRIDIDSTKHLDLGVTAAVTRGLFARNVITPNENNQGPYRLIGNGGETFIVIIAGTERVFINGQLMQRGADLDYVINYNLGEIVFTPKRLITQDLRIIVEFQYSDRNYFRYTLESQAQYQAKKFKAYSQIYFEKDDQNQPLSQNLNASQIDVLKRIGNDIDSAFIPSERNMNWEPNRIFYIKKDTVVQGNRYENIYQWTTRPVDSPLQVVFTLVGANQGNYKLKATNANGAVYEWVAPIQNVPQGSFEPILKVATPKHHLQTILGMSYQINPNWNTSAEITMTQHDLNLYSEVDNHQNFGYASLFQSEYQKQFNKNQKLRINIQNEYSSAHFSPVTRYRNLEFNRDWGLNLNTRNSGFQNISSLAMQYNNAWLTTSYHLNYFKTDVFFEGLQQVLEYKMQFKRWEWFQKMEYVQSQYIDSTATFFRPQGNIKFFLDSSKKWMLSAGILFEQRINDNKNTQLRSLNSFYWQNYFFQFGTAPQLPNRTLFEYTYRTEKGIVGNQFSAPLITSHTFKWSGAFEKSFQHQFRYLLSYRNFKSLMQSNNNELMHNYMGRLDYNGQFFRGFFRVNNIYELKAGREQKTQITYVRAPNGYGTHAWNDINKNGIFELDEAYVSPFPLENRYVRFFTVLPEFIPANEMTMSPFLWIQPKALWFNASGIRKWMSKLSYQVRMDLLRKQLAQPTNSLFEYMNPVSDVLGSQVVSSRSNIFQQLSFQKNESDFGMDLEYAYLDLKNLMTNGFDASQSKTWLLKIRKDLGTRFGLLSKAGHTLKKNQSDFFADRNYGFIHNQLEQTFRWNATKNMTLNINAIYWFKSTGNQFSINRQADIEWVVARKNNAVFEVKSSIMKIDYQYQTQNPQVELAMLNGIQPGTNWITTINIGQKLTDMLQLNIIYNGRYNAQNDLFIHNANMEVRALF
jgi:hypothetical protein